MTTVTELPAAYEARGEEEEVMTRPVEPVTPLMLACQQENDQEVRRILSKQVSTARRNRGTAATQREDLMCGLLNVVISLVADYLFRARLL